MLLDKKNEEPICVQAVEQQLHVTFPLQPRQQIKWRCYKSWGPQDCYKWHIILMINGLINGYVTC